MQKREPTNHPSSLKQLCEGHVAALARAERAMQQFQTLDAIGISISSAGGPEEGEHARLVDLVAVHVGQGRAILGRVGGHSRHEEAEEERQGNGAVLHEGRAHRLNEDLRVRLGSRASRDVGCSTLSTLQVR